MSTNVPHVQYVEEFFELLEIQSFKPAAKVVKLSSANMVGWILSRAGSALSLDGELDSDPANKCNHSNLTLTYGRCGQIVHNIMTTKKNLLFLSL